VITVDNGPFTLSAAGSKGSVSITPDAALVFTAGVWAGHVTAHTADAGVTLTALDSLTRTGSSNVFVVHDNVILEFVPDVGIVSTENGKRVVSVAPNTTIIHFTAVADDAPLDMAGFTLDFTQSNSNLALKSWTTGATWTQVLDGSLNMITHDNTVAASSPPRSRSRPPWRWDLHRRGPHHARPTTPSRSAGPARSPRSKAPAVP